MKGRSITNLVEPVYIHYEFNNYKPELMVKENDYKYHYDRMVPPGKHKYFYTSDWEPEIAKDQRQHPGNLDMDPVDLKIVFEDNLGQYEKTLTITGYNELRRKAESLVNDHYEVQVTKCVPRPEEIMYQRISLEK